MQKKNLFTLLAAAAVTSATAAYADTPRYDFVDLSYQSISDPPGTGSGIARGFEFSSDHAYGLDASYALTDNWVLGGGYSHENADVSYLNLAGTANGDSYELGIGYRFPLSDSVDLVPSLSYLSEHASESFHGPSVSNSDSGYDAGVELRAMVTPVVELDANVDHTTPGFATNQVGVAALYNFTRSFAVGLGFAESTSNKQNTSGWTLALRYYFK